MAANERARRGGRWLPTILRHAGGSFALRVGGAAATFATGVALARLLGVEGFGIYSYAIAWVGLLGLIAAFGFNQLLVREISIYLARESWGHIKGILRFSERAVLTVSIALLFVASGISWLLAELRFSTMKPFEIWLALLSLPFVAQIQLRQAATRGLGRVIEGQLPDTFLRPVLFALLICCAYLFLSKSLSPAETIALYVLSVISTFALSSALLARALPENAKRTPPRYSRRIWMRSAVPLLFVSGLEVVNSHTDLIMIGAMAGPTSAGLYAVAVRGAGLIVFVFVAVNMTIAPRVAQMHDLGDKLALQRLVRHAAYLTFCFSSAACAGLILFGDLFLSLFGPAFAQARTALNILLVGQFLNAMAGSVGLILKMTGYGWDVARTGALSALVNVVLNALLIPRYGIEGAATATAISAALWPISAAVLVHRRIGINPTIFHRPS